MRVIHLVASLVSALAVFAPGAFAQTTEQHQADATQIIAHYRGKEGASLPIANENVDPRFRAAVSSAIDTFIHGFFNDARSLASLPPLPACPYAHTRPYALNLPQTEIETGSDLLFIKGDPPARPEEMFGKNVIIQMCSARGADYCAVQADGYGVQCTPSRIHFEGTKAVIMEGIFALRNYDIAPGGKLHEEVENNVRTYFEGNEK